MKQPATSSLVSFWGLEPYRFSKYETRTYDDGLFLEIQSFDEMHTLNTHLPISKCFLKLALHVFPNRLIYSTKNSSGNGFATQWLGTSPKSMINLRFNVQRSVFIIFVTLHLGKSYSARQQAFWSWRRLLRSVYGVDSESHSFLISQLSYTDVECSRWVRLIKVYKHFPNLNFYYHTVFGFNIKTAFERVKTILVLIQWFLWW